MAQNKEGSRKDMKAILVIDVDDNTDFEFYDVRVWCYNKTTGLHKWYQNVQLKPMPKKQKEVEDTEYIYEDEDRMASCIVGQIEGWNSCIDEILGEENG